jgi:AcrR family transcriptional regulator
MAPRLRRAEMVERNREAVLAAARRVFIEKGYIGATLEAIAEEAGFSTGVVYSQFESKADLFLTLLERHLERFIAEYSGLEGWHGFVESVTKYARTDAAWTRVLVEFRVLASRDPSLNARYAAAHSRNVDRLAAALERLCVKAELQPRFPPRVMAEVFFALQTGTNLEQAANPAAVPVETVLRMLTRAFGFTAEEETAHPRDPHGAD